MTEVKKTELGKFIKKKAEEKGFESLRQLAYASDVSNSEISRICSGERIKPNPKKTRIIIVMVINETICAPSSRPACLRTRQRQEDIQIDPAVINNVGM